jgi:hypothetical protein
MVWGPWFEAFAGELLAQLDNQIDGLLRQPGRSGVWPA